jgi:hypothetical protein
MALSHDRQMAGAYRDLFRAIAAALFEMDPMGICGESNTDEYEAEASALIPRLRKCSCEADLLRVLVAEFNEWFGPGSIGPESRYAEPAARIWRLWLDSGLAESAP